MEETPSGTVRRARRAGGPDMDVGIDDQHGLLHCGGDQTDPQTRAGEAQPSPRTVRELANPGPRCLECGVG